MPVSQISPSMRKSIPIFAPLLLKTVPEYSDDILFFLSDSKPQLYHATPGKQDIYQTLSQWNFDSPPIVPLPLHACCLERIWLSERTTKFRKLH